MTDRDTLLRAAAEFGKFVAAGLLDYDEAESLLLRRANQITSESDELLDLESQIADQLRISEQSHTRQIVDRVRAAIRPLILARACTAAILAQARHANNQRGRINALPDAEISELVRADLANAAAHLKEARRA